MVLGLLLGKKKKKAKPKKVVKVKKAAKKVAKKKAVRKKKNIQQVGVVTHYFPKVKATIIKISKGPLSMGDTLYIKGHTTDCKQKITSMQIEHVAVKKAAKGDEIGLKTRSRAREGDIVYKEFLGDKLNG